jgi:hypothetical protein
VFGILETGSLKLFAQVGLVLWFFWSLSPKSLRRHMWATGTIELTFLLAFCNKYFTSCSVIFKHWNSLKLFEPTDLFGYIVVNFSLQIYIFNIFTCNFGEFMEALQPTNGLLKLCAKQRTLIRHIHCL